ncbi:MAG: Smr/MutS family protein [Bacteroidales bacterium]|nr:Smr/MutS family protein [Bacteroidales bacterium]
MVYPDSFEDKIGFSQVRQKVVDLCVTPLGSEWASTIHASSDFTEVGALLDDVVEFTDIILHHTDFPELAPVDIRDSVKKGRIPGAYLDVTEWLDVRRLLASVRQIEVFFEKLPAEILPATRGKSKQLKTFPFIQEKLDQIFNKTGQVRDQASADLKKIRQDMVHLQASIGRRMDTVLQQARSEGWIEKDVQPSIRDGRLVIPVPVTHKRRIKGLIHDESATGRTAFVEPIELVELNNELRELELAEQREIVKILVELTNQLRPYFPDMENWNGVIASFDLTRAKAKISIRWDGTQPLLREDPYIHWEKARHPLLDLAFRSENKKVIPQDIHLDNKQRILLISGPNAGGKSVCLKAAGLIQYLIQCGFMVPVQEGSESGIFDQFLLDIGDEQSIENDLSTYSSHLHHMKFFLKKAGDKTLFMIDEFGAGTEPQLGGAIAESILSELTVTGAYGVVTTHYSNLKHFAASADGVVNAAMRYDVQHMQPLFELETGKPGSSFAFEIARNIGLPDVVIQKATGLVGDDHIQFDKHLREISRDKRYWENKRQKIRQNSKELDELLAKYSEILAITEKDRKKIIQETRQKSEELLSGINKKIEQSIREIRESQAEKLKVREIRENLESLRDSIKAELNQTISEGDEKLESAEKESNKIRKKLVIEKPVAEVKPVMAINPWSVGSKIRIKDKDIFAEILETRADNLLIAMGQMITTIPVSQAEPVSENEFKKATGTKSYGTSFAGVDMENRKLSFSPNIDVRGMRADEALQKVTTFIDEAIMFGAGELRILHGKGDGILRRMIRDYLSGVNVVSKYEDEDIRMGGTGITIVKLSW